MASRHNSADVIVGLCVLLLVGTAAVAAAARTREADNRVRCESNLRQLGEAILRYQTENARRFPRALSGDDADPTPTWGTPYASDATLGPVDRADPLDPAGPVRPRPDDVTAALFLVMRTQRIAGPAFVCPSTAATPFDFGGGTHTALDWTNWPGGGRLADHLSYSFVDPYPGAAAVSRGYDLRWPGPDPTVVWAGDMNPGGPAERALTRRSPPAVKRAANSGNHQRDGQNLLFADGHVTFCPTPFSGTHDDNVYTAGGPELPGPSRGPARVVGGPVDATDTVLLPSSADLAEAAK